jgi:hypothetical protein
MHLINLNDPDLLLGLWRSTIKVYPPDKPEFWSWHVLVGDVWHTHGKTVALTTPFILSSFGHAPQNPAEKINSVLSSGSRASEPLAQRCIHL